MKVLIIITTAFVPTGGLTTVMMNYYRNMDKSNIIIDFASTNVAPTVLTDELKKNGGKYVQLPMRKRIFKYYNTLKQICKQYDVIHVNGNSATSAIELLAAKMAGVSVRIAHNHNTNTEHPIIHRLLLPIFRHTYTIGLACSSDAGNWLFSEGNFEVLNNAIDVRKYMFDKAKRNKIRNEFNIPQETFVIGHVGKYNEQKNHHKIIEVFYEYAQLHNNAILLCVGYGPLKNIIESKIKELGITEKVILTGERIDVPELLCAMDFFIFPSLWEGLGLAVIEAQASGLPCLLSDQVPQDVYLSNHITSLPIKSENKVWVQKIESMTVYNREENSKQNAISITKGGYNISEQANKLLEIYSLSRK